MRLYRHWIPPVPLAVGLLFQCAAWVLVLIDAFAPSFGLELAWVHAVALGWLTLVALAVLLHVIPAFTDLVWYAESVARAAVIVVAAGAVLLVVSFAAGLRTGLVAGAALLAGSILVYVALAIRTLSRPTEDPADALVARALTVTQVVLALTVVLGGALAAAYVWGNVAILVVAPSHAVLGIVAWLTLLASGVSVRTFRPMLGAASRWRRGHVVADAGFLAGALVVAVSAPLSAAGVRAGVLIVALAAAAYVIDALDILRRATSPHVGARAFVAAAIGWLAVATVLAVAASWDLPVAAAATVIALAGWLGQMVNAHLHHLGVRVVSTLILGDADETRPWTLLTPALTWIAFLTAQLAVTGTALRAAGAASPAALFAGVAGLCSIGCIAANAASAVRRARGMRRAKPPISLLVP